MLSEQENQMLTRVGPGTPGGELLRRYWHPLCPASELTPERPKKRIRILGEDLVVYRDPDGSYGLVGERCAHRGASLYYGFIEDGGIRCPYHGWLYDKAGHCMEQPFEPRESTMKYTVRLPGYPIEKLAGLLFVYLGPEPTPLLPRWDVLAREDGERTVEVHRPVLNCNWLQCQENSIDPTHNYYLHGHTAVLKGLRSSQRLRPPETYNFEVMQWGIIKRRTYGGDGGLNFAELGHPAVFPNILRHWLEGRNGGDVFEGTAPIDMHWRVPIDDTHTQVFWMGFIPTQDGSLVEHAGDPPVTYVTVKDENDEFHMNDFPSQDEMAWETQGPIADRTNERLGAGDTGVAMWRKLLKEQIDIVQEGGDPIGVVRDPERNRVIDLGPSRMLVGDRYVPKPWTGWGSSEVWESHTVQAGELAARQVDPSRVSASPTKERRYLRSQ